MGRFRMSELLWVLAAASGMALINGHAADFGNIAQGEFRTGFGPSRGWPFKCIARAPEVGRFGADRTTHWATTVYRNAFNHPSGLPNLAVNWLFFGINFWLAALVVIAPIAYVRLCRAREKTPVKDDDFLDSDEVARSEVR
jgi:hypothetical protein